jgi:hypothetical protein
VIVHYCLIALNQATLDAKSTPKLHALSNGIEAYSHKAFIHEDTSYLVEVLSYNILFGYILLITGTWLLFHAKGICGNIKPVGLDSNTSNQLVIYLFILLILTSITVQHFTLLIKIYHINFYSVN